MTSKQRICECSYSSVGELVHKCPNHETVKVHSAINPSGSSSAEKDVVQQRSDQISNASDERTTYRCRCGTINLESNFFCGQCGKSLTRYCCRCGAKNPDSNSFCGKCGEPLDVGKDGVFRAVSPPYRWMAARGAWDLPEELDILLLFAWCDASRGPSVPEPSDITSGRLAFAEFSNWMKVTLEEAERQGRVPVTKRLDRDLARLLLQDKGLSFRQAVEVYADSIRQGRTFDGVQCEHARTELIKQICHWLDSALVPYSSLAPLRIPTTAIVSALSMFSGLPDVHFDPNIPRDKLENALGGYPANDKAAVLIDCTWLGSARDCVVFGSRGVYHSNGSDEGYIPYAEFANQTFTPEFREGKVNVTRGGPINLSRSQLYPAKLVEMLDALKKQVSQRSGSRPTQSSLSAVAGMAELKKLLWEEVVEPLRNPEKFRRYGIGIPNGILLYGPPGCGKTFIARHLAAELNYDFQEITPGTIASPYIHDTVAKISAVFASAASSAPSVLFVDEFEGLVPDRNALGGHAQYKAEEVNEWLVQMGSCGERGVFFIAATKQPARIDEAVRRSGRLDKKIYVGPPDGPAILEMLKFHLSQRPLSSPDDVRAFASSIEGQGYSASDLKLLVDEAAKFAFREDQPITLLHLQKAAVERVSPSISLDADSRYLPDQP